MEDAEPGRVDLYVPESGHLSETALDYARRGIGTQMGMGQRPILVVIDMCKAFLDDSYGLGKAMPEVVTAVQACVKAFRDSERPVVFVKTDYAASMADAGVWARKIPALQELVSGSQAVEMHEDLLVRTDDLVITKKASSAFFGTGLASICVAQRIDTVISVGVSTSACVRATVVDSCSYGFRTGVVVDAVGDRSSVQHEANLFDMQAKYADLLSLDELKSYLRGASE